MSEQNQTEGVDAGVTVVLNAEKDEEGTITVDAQLGEATILLTIPAGTDLDLAQAFVAAFPQIAERGLYDLALKQAQGQPTVVTG